MSGNPPRGAWLISRIVSGLRTPDGGAMTSRTTDQIAVVAPIPSASVVTAKMVKAGASDSRRHATTMSLRKPPMVYAGVYRIPLGVARWAFIEKNAVAVLA